MKKEEAIEKLTNGEKIDFNTLVRKLKKEGTENFAITKKEYIETVLSMLKEKDEMIEYYQHQKKYDEQFKHELLEDIRCKQLKIDSLNKILDDRLIYIRGGRGLYAKLKGLDKEYLIREYLSMLKEKDKESHFIQSKLDEANAKIIEKDKIIDLMASSLYDYANLETLIKCPAEYNGNYNLENCRMSLADRNCLVCIKKYFENKLNSSEQN